MLRLTPVVKNLLVINIVVFILQKLLGNLYFTELVSLWPIGSENWKPYQFFSYMFAHGDFGHILFNMIGLIFLGPMLEHFWGPKRFLTFYLVTGIGAGVLYGGIEYVKNKRVERAADQFVSQPTPQKYLEFVNDFLDFRESKSGIPYDALFRRGYSQQGVLDLADKYEGNPENDFLEQQAIQVVKDKNWLEQNLGLMLGASGAIYGILMAFGLLFPNTELMLIFPPIPVKAKYLVLVLGGIALYSGFSSNPEDNTAHFAHLGGMIFAFIMIKIWQQGRDRFY